MKKIIVTSLGIATFILMIILQIIITTTNLDAETVQRYAMRPCIPKPGYDYAVACRLEVIEPECSYMPCTSFEYPSGNY